MNSIYYISDNIICSLGNNTSSIYNQILSSNTGTQLMTNAKLSNHTLPLSAIANEHWSTIQINNYSPLESLAIASIYSALSNTNINASSKDTLIVFSTTKGNISDINNANQSANTLHQLALKVSHHFGNTNLPITISTACISGLAALIAAKRMLEIDQYKNAIVVGVDILSAFVISGFQSFQALSDTVCRPFDKDRKGLNLGEAAATIILSTEKKSNIILAGGATTNDANHLSGPSRTGEELSLAINRAISEAEVSAKDIDMAACHGTATLYNDEMETKALALSGLIDVPIHSIKGNVGHTLGAAGILESIIACQGMLHDTLIPSYGYDQLGVSTHVIVTTKPTKSKINHVLKTASGFGGCNAAVVWSKLEN